MAFWGVSIPGNGSYTIPSQLPPRRLRITDASSFCSELDLLRLEVKVGENMPIPVAIGKGLTKLRLEFQESSDVVLTVNGPAEVHLVGYYHTADRDQEFSPIRKPDVSNNLEGDVELKGQESTKNVADLDAMESNVLEERLVSNGNAPKVGVLGDTFDNQLPGEHREPCDLDGAVSPLNSFPEPVVIRGHDDDHEDTLSPDVNIDARETDEANILEIARQHSEIDEDVALNISSSKEEMMDDKQEQMQIIEPTKADENLQSDATQCEERNSDLEPVGRVRKKKRKLVFERNVKQLDTKEKIHEDLTSMELADEDKQHVEDTVEDSSYIEKTDPAPTKKSRRPKKAKLKQPISSDPDQKKTLTSDVPSECTADSRVIVLGLSTSSETAPKKDHEEIDPAPAKKSKKAKKAKLKP